MHTQKPIKSALISVFTKDKLDELVQLLAQHGVKIYSTGGTLEFIKNQGIEATAVETLTGYPSILGGRVKTLHPKVFGGILARRENPSDIKQLADYQIPEIDMVVVDLYPFEETVASGATDAEIIEKIDIGGVSLIRAAAKNHADVLIVSDRAQYAGVIDMLRQGKCSTTLQQRHFYAAQAFANTAHYDSAIAQYFSAEAQCGMQKSLRYGENPHQQAVFEGNFEAMFDQLHGKEVSYNNILDIDAAVALIGEFSDPAVAIIKHNNACGAAVRNTLLQAWVDALAGDPVSAFGGVIVANRTIDAATADEINKLFFEVLIAPDFAPEALDLLRSKKNRIILRQKSNQLPEQIVRSALNGVLKQQRDTHREQAADLKVVTNIQPAADQIDDMLFANIIVKHSKSNAIVLAKNRQLLASGVGQTSRVDAVRHSVAKAQSFGFELKGAVMASDAFFPFADGVEVAAEAGINAVIQPGGSVRDQEVVDFCNQRNVAMVYTGIRHFKH